jgi:uncharacterized protein (DUF427 family)
MKTPGPDHRISIEPAAKRWRARFAGHVMADTGAALILHEAGHPPRVYFPRADVSMDYMSRTEATTHCPYKGDAAYYTVLMDGQFAENAVWTYEHPFPAMDAIAERLAFHPERVEIYEVDEAAVNPHREPPPDRAVEGEEDFAITVDEVVQHTDSGSGAAQKEHWPTNVSEPEG